VLPVVATTFLLGPSAMRTEAEVFEVPPERGIQLGQGVNSVSVEPLGLCLASGPVTDPGGGQVVEVEASLFESRDELEGFLKVEAQAGLNLPFTASGKFQLLRDTYQLETATYAFIKVSVRNPTRNLTEHRWASPLPLELLAQGPEHFFAACGDRFVHGVSSGGELIVEVKVTHVTEKEKTLIIGHLEANFGILEGLADLQAKLRRLHQESAFSYRLYRRGSVGPIEFDVESLVEQVENFPLEVREDPWDMSFEVLPYSVLLGAEVVNLGEERTYVRELARRRNDWADTVDRLASVAENRWQFAPTVRARQLSRNIARFRAHIEELDRTFFECVAELPEGCPIGVFPTEPTEVAIPRRILLDRLWWNRGSAAWCLGAMSTKPRSGCDARRAGFAVADGSWANAELFEAPQPSTGMMTLWTEPKGESVGWTMRQLRGLQLFACPSGRVVGTRGTLCGPSDRATESVGYTFDPRIP
jgi:hypothetical protein